jgi:plasmid stability protein
MPARAFTKMPAEPKWNVAMISIRNLDESLKARLRMRAAYHNRSMEEEARVILREALQGYDGERGLGTLIH